MNTVTARVGFLAILFAATPVSAQDLGVTGSVELAEGASPREMLDFVAKSLAEMDQAVEAATALLREAEKSGDADAVDCVSAKLRTIKNMRDVSARVQAAVNEQLAAGAPARADHEARKIGVAVGIVRRNAAEAQACVGDAAGSEGEDIRDAASDNEGGEDETDPLSTADELGVDPPNTSPF